MEDEKEPLTELQAKSEKFNGGCVYDHMKRSMERNGSKEQKMSAPFQKEGLTVRYGNSSRTVEK